MVKQRKKDSHIGILYFEQLMDLTAIYIGHHYCPKSVFK